MSIEKKRIQSPVEQWKIDSIFLNAFLSLQNQFNYVLARTGNYYTDWMYLDKNSMRRPINTLLDISPNEYINK